MQWPGRLQNELELVWVGSSWPMVFWVKEGTPPSFRCVWRLRVQGRRSRASFLPAIVFGMLASEQGSLKPRGSFVLASLKSTPRLLSKPLAGVGPAFSQSVKCYSCGVLGGGGVLRVSERVFWLKTASVQPENKERRVCCRKSVRR